MAKRILLIGDDEAMKKLFLSTLEDTWYQIDTAKSGQKAINMARSSKYNLIYLDLKMPGMSGIDILRELRKIDKDVPVYIITAFHQDFFNELQNARKDDIDYELLLRPFGCSELAIVTKGVLEGPVTC